MYRLGIDIGGTKINIGFFDENKSCVLKHSLKIPENKDYKSVLETLKNTINNVLSENKIDKSSIVSCGIGVPGTVSQDGKTAIKMPNLGWENAEVAEEFYNLLNIKTILLQDSRAAAYGEYMAGAAQGMNVVVCVTLGTGIGTGIVVNDEIFNGGLFGAGELGHIPVVENGRKCGCGKTGCLEKYVAGIGFDLTAKEIYGADATGRDIFNNAEKGDEIAIKVINDAVVMLGNAMVSAVNLLSPDCLLFSGGLSKEEKLLINPLKKYIEDKCYSACDKKIKIAIAELGEDAPMVGAALSGIKNKAKEPILSASIMCADMLNLGRDLKEIEESGIKYLHCDIMDGHFVPNLMLPVEMLANVRKGSNLPFDIHLMVEKPENIIPMLKIGEGDIVSIHYESTPHVQRALSLINSTGAMAAIAINPSTPIECIRECLDDVGMVLIMTVNPGFAGQKLVANSLDKISRTRKYLDDLGYNDIIIEVDGNCSFENVPKMYKAGADIFVVGTSSVFNSQNSITDGVKKLLSLIEED